ncbi:non-classical export 1 [Pyrenophora seminiperda CCB06]|uniref:Non-classical export 1 n=1 Tax=Pyrenophora seminiperda CCB06 TaxID=1302712 RepID=A0A3M7LXW3_9PLEO|nr:non-classical export 1 [Pyrenophora seminiperda CCB06]
MVVQYIISKRLDPLFAISIGLAAALTRIKREEKEKGRNMAESMEVFRRRVGLAWGRWEGREL